MKFSIFYFFVFLLSFAVPSFASVTYESTTAIRNLSVKLPIDRTLSSKKKSKKTKLKFQKRKKLKGIKDTKKNKLC